MSNRLAWAGLFASLVIVVVLLWRVNLKVAAEQVRQFGWSCWFVGASVYMSAFLPRGWRWKLLLPDSKRLPWAWITKSVVIGYAANNVLPLRLGEVVRSFLVGDRFNLSKLTCLGTIVAEKVLDGCCLLGMLAASLPFIRIQSGSLANFTRMFLLAASFFGAAIVGCVVLALCGRKILSIMERRCPNPVIRVTRAGVNAFAVFGKPKTFLAAAGLTLIIWTLEAICFANFLKKLGVEGAFPKGVFCLVVVNLSILIPSAPGYVGVFQAGAVGALLALGMSSSSGLALGVAIHAAQFVPTTLLGLVLASQMGLRWRRLYDLKNE